MADELAEMPGEGGEEVAAPKRQSEGAPRRSRPSGAGSQGAGDDRRGSEGSGGRRSLLEEMDLPIQDEIRRSFQSYNYEIPGEDYEEDTGYRKIRDEMLGEGGPKCPCDPADGPCDCKTPEESGEGTPKSRSRASLDAAEENYQLDEFMRAKNYFLQTSNKSGLNLYDHLSDVIRKFLDERAPNNPVDYLEEVSMNIKRYRFGIRKADTLQDAFYISDPVLQDAKKLLSYWKYVARWNDEKSEVPGEAGPFVGGSFQNLLRMQYYLEQVNIGLPREEMFRVALAVKELSATRPQLGRFRFWGKIFGTQKNYYVVEAEMKFGASEQSTDLWVPQDEENRRSSLRITQKVSETLEGLDPCGPEPVLDAQKTFTRAKDVVLNTDFLTAYSKTSGLPPDKQGDLLPKPTIYFMPNPAMEWAGEDGEAEENMLEFEDPDALAEATKWEGYQQELMENFPQAGVFEESEIPMESDGTGLNRRIFYVTNEPGEDWCILPPVTPKQINCSRNVRWFLTGKLNSRVTTLPEFPGLEGHYLKALLIRATAGGMASPKGYYRPKLTDRELPGEDEDEDEELEPEDEDLPPPGNDSVVAAKKFKAPMKALTNPNLQFWVHHTGPVLQQGRAVWWNPNQPKPKRGERGEATDEEDEDDEDEDDEEEGEDGAAPLAAREVGPPLFTSIAKDSAPDGRAPWSLTTSSSVFQEFQVVQIRSNTWTGSNVICTVKGKVSNIYLGDGLKFSPATYCPPIPNWTAKEYKFGPELEETADPSVETEQEWLDKLALNEIADTEPKFIDNEYPGEGEEDDEEEETEFDDD